MRVESIPSRMQRRADDEKRFQQRTIREIKTLCEKYLDANDEDAVVNIYELGSSLKDSWQTYTAYTDFLDSLGNQEEDLL